MTQTISSFALTYKGAVTAAMVQLADNPRIVFVGQNVLYPGHVIYETLALVPKERRIEVPVFEETQTGIAIGLALAGYIPVSVYPRMDFLTLAVNQLVNHLDKLGEMSQGQFQPHVIIRTMLGNTEPLHPGPQHCQNHIEAFRLLLKHTLVLTPTTPHQVIVAYKLALEARQPVMVVEQPYR
jgi:pyruvate/2-oxoglutarate/acetoin dehydrogenase E1 component